jgi:SAM-dependent methyltransferase
MTTFDDLADAYDAARPGYPHALYDALEAAVGRLRDRVVLDGGAGTGLASRDLTARGASVIAFDIAERMLRKAIVRDATSVTAVADGTRLPIRTGTIDVVCFAQTWHWLDARRAVAEALRVLRPGGWWAGWWSHPRADGETWFDNVQDVLEATCPAYDRRQRDIDWGATVVDPAGFAAPRFIRVPWQRELSLDAWLVDETSKSYVGALTPDARADLLARLTRIVSDTFPTGTLAIRYETWLWTVQRQ